MNAWIRYIVVGKIYSTVFYKNKKVYDFLSIIFSQPRPAVTLNKPGSSLSETHYSTLPVTTMVRTMNKLLLLLCVGMLTLSILSSAAVAYGNGNIFDITHKITSELPTFDSKSGLGQFIWLVSSIKNGSIANVSEFKLGTHTGTHVDAPSHFFQKYYEKGFDVTTLSLQALNGPALVVDVPRNKNITGPALVVDVPRNKNITAEVMKSLNIPRGVHRVLFKTLNTDRRLMHKKEFASDFTGFKKDGAQWLVDNTDIKLVGLDYLSVSAYVDAAPTHHIFLKKREIVLVEGLNLDGIKPGKYTVHCLPLRMVGADGCPTRCILTA